MTKAVANQRFSSALQSALTMDEVASAYLGTVDRVIPADGLGLYELDPAGRSVVDVRATVGEKLLEGYEEYGRQDDPILRFVAEHQRPIDSSRVTHAEEWESCGARQALATEGFAHSMEAPLLVSGMLFGTINFARPEHCPTFSTRDLASARTVSEQLGLAVERALRYEATGQRATALEHALDRLAQGVVVTDLEGQVLFQNRVARRDWDLQVGAGSTPLHGAIADCIMEAMSAFRDGGKRVFTRNVQDHASKRKTIVKSYRLSGRDSTAVTLAFPCAEDPMARQLPVWDVLTPREQEIAQLVSEGFTTKQIAARAFISENTVKQHLKRVFAKTDVSTRAGLVQLIWTSGHAAEPEDDLA
jgi:DNA-binding CsgD family transcriptional regulator/PAS domain-containing protein